MQESKEEKNNRHNSIATSIIRRVILVILGLIIGTNAYLANAKTLTGNQMPMPFGYGAAVVLSGSMEPVLSKGDLIIVKEKESYKVGDVVVFQSGKSLIVHRIIKIDDKKVITQGDANNVADPEFDTQFIKGKEVFRIPYIGVLVDIIKTPTGTIVILILAFWMVEYSFRKQKNEDSKKQEEIKAEIRRLKEEQKKKCE
ncbi:MAG: signal peptidase I [Lachnospiraceae bacterium]|jgi:signal peptidase|nr:signal peptidase I [Lachnospiraceae bacterium]